ncbi:hypothetical protein TW78_00930 [Vibrio coralliilyticus]|uniref:Uncharacterized protein n=1 Tax=Vibrio coralliilyticus TaxID=190893 RepID=A0A837G403_9VIBR|nr:hypothetical protein [Vibrio coralliilyticus]KJY79298.1 hypothetical protein TW78_00930 [Vibrio coralliilyticus]QOU30786.1 hypothetical protein TW71_004530 [Vibrio coralliilyticus]
MFFQLGKEKYFCNKSGDVDPVELDYQDIRKTWVCPCCSIPVTIEATSENDGIQSYLRLSVKDIEVGDYVYIHGSGFLSVVAAGKQNDSYFLAIKGHGRLSKLKDTEFFNTLDSGKFWD